MKTIIYRQLLRFPKKIASYRPFSSYGFINLPNVKSTDDFLRLAKDAIIQSNNIQEIILSKGGIHNKSDTLMLMDYVSNILCTAIDAAEFTRNVHSDPSFRQVSEQVFSIISQYIHKVNTNKALYAKLCEIESDNTSLTPEENIFVMDLKKEFESDGIHLENEIKEKAIELQGKIVNYEAEFMRNITNEDSTFRLGPFEPTENLIGLRNWLSQYVKQDELIDSKLITLICPVNRRVSLTLLRSLDDPSLREQIWRNIRDEPQANPRLLGQLIKTRSEYACLLGYNSFADKYLANKVVKTPDQVLSLLRLLSRASDRALQKEVRQLTQLKERIRDAISSQNFTKSPPERLFPWDLPYLMELHRHVQANRHSAEEEKLRQTSLSKLHHYLPISACLEGLEMVCRELFGLRFQREGAVRAEELWVDQRYIREVSHLDDSNTVNSAVLADLGIYKYQVYGRIPSHSEFTSLDPQTGNESSSNESLLGTLYLDLFRREGKFTGSAQFTVRCGCENSPEAAGAALHRLKHSLPPPPPSSPCHQSQLPIVCLVLNFTNTCLLPGVSERKNGKGGGAHSLLTFNEAENLFHEWGHAVHSLLSRTRFQHLSGTRGGIDFAEIPSHLFEYFFRTPEVTALWARDPFTGERAPLSLLQSAMKSKRDFSAIEIHTQILLSAADQLIFSSSFSHSRISNMSPDEVYSEACAQLVQVQGELSPSLPSAPATPTSEKPSNQDKSLPYMMLPSHSHFVTYGGGYYSYLFARLYAAQIWEKRFRDKPLSRKSGIHLWGAMLRYGASKNMMEMLDEVAGPLDPKFYLGQII